MKFRFILFFVYGLIFYLLPFSRNNKLEIIIENNKLNLKSPKLYVIGSILSFLYVLYYFPGRIITFRFILFLIFEILYYLIIFDNNFDLFNLNLGNIKSILYKI